MGEPPSEEGVRWAYCVANLFIRRAAGRHLSHCDGCHSFKVGPAASMWKHPALVCLLLVGCSPDPVHSTLCEMGPGFRSWEGSKVRLNGMLMVGGDHYGPMIVDLRCSRGIQIAWPAKLDAIQKVLEAPGSFNKTATVTGKIFVGPQNKRWLLLSDIRNVEVDAKLSESAEDHIFERMVRIGNNYYRHQRQ